MHHCRMLALTTARPIPEGRPPQATPSNFPTPDGNDADSVHSYVAEASDGVYSVSFVAVTQESQSAHGATCDLMLCMLGHKTCSVITTCCQTLSLPSTAPQLSRCACFRLGAGRCFLATLLKATHHYNLPCSFQGDASKKG